MGEDDESEEEMTTKVKCTHKSKLKANEDHSAVCQWSVFMLCLLPQQKQEKQVTPKKTPEVTNEDEYADSTDVDAPGLF